LEAPPVRVRISLLCSCLFSYLLWPTKGFCCFCHWRLCW
jgi:hypothetical protein